MNVIIDESVVMEANIFTERARVLSNTLLNDYFQQDIHSQKDLWKLGGCYYEDARIIMETILSMICDADKLLSQGLEKAPAENRGIVCISQ